MKGSPENPCVGGGGVRGWREHEIASRREPGRERDGEARRLRLV
jgi:hypothetical protein